MDIWYPFSDVAPDKLAEERRRVGTIPIATHERIAQRNRMAARECRRHTQSAFFTPDVPRSGIFYVNAWMSGQRCNDPR